MNAALAFRLAVLTLCVAFVVEAAMLVVEHTLQPEESVLENRSDGSGAGARLADPTDPMALVARNPFGPAALGSKPKPPPQPKPEAPPPPPRSGKALGLRLLGTAVDENNQGVAAIIHDDRARTQDVYRLGAQIRPQHTIKEIRRLAAVLATPGGDVLLSMDDDASWTAPAIPQARRDGPTITLDRAVIEEHLQDIAKLAKDATISAVKYQGQPAYRISNIRPGSAYTILRLREGDILVGVDGEPVTDPQMLMQMYEQGTSGVTLNLIRRGRRQNINLSLAD